MVELTFSINMVFSLVVGIAMAAGLVIGVHELIWLYKSGRLQGKQRREMVLSVSQIPPYVITSLFLMPIWLILYETASRLSLFTITTTPMVVVLALLMADFSYYWEHRCAHKIGILWKLYHAMHHSSSAYTIATAYRVSFLNQFLAPAFYLPWLLLGVEPLLIFGFQLIAFHYQAWLHTELIGELGPLDKMFNTPANHRMHHSQSKLHKDTNFGAILMIWDHVFGTYQKPGKNITYGIPGSASPESFLSLYTFPFKSIPETAKSKGVMLNSRTQV